MKVILDENVNRRLAADLPGHDVSSVTGLGWHGIKNGALFQLVSQSQFEAFVTVDKNMQFQQSMVGKPFALLVLDIHPINHQNQVACCPQILETLKSCLPGKVYVIDGPHPKRD